MNFALLGWIALAQAIFLVFLSVLLVIARGHAVRRATVTESRRAAVSSAISRWLADDVPAEAVLETLDRCGSSVGLAALQSVAMMRSGTEWERVVRLLSNTGWLVRVRKQVRSRFWWNRLESARGLAILATQDDLSLLLELLEDPNLAVRLAAASGLRRLPDPYFVSAVLDFAIATNAVTRGFLIETLAASDEYRIPILLERLGAASDPRVLRPLLDLAGQLRSPDLLTSVLSFSEYPDLEVRIAATRALGGYPSQRTGDRLLELLYDDAWQVRAQSAGALGAIGAAEAIPDLRRALQDPNWWVRLRAALSLRVLGREGVDTLLGITAEEDQFAHDIATYVLRLDRAAIAEFGGKIPADFGDFVGRVQAA